MAEVYKGITNDGNIQEGLFELHSTGISTNPVRKAAIGFLNSLDDSQQKKINFLSGISRLR